MSDTVYEKNGLSATRFWGGKSKDCVQLTLSGQPRLNGYATLTLDEFRQMYQAIEKNVEDTKNAWWHGVSKEAKTNQELKEGECLKH